MNKLKGKAKPTVSPAKQKAQMAVLGVLVLVAAVVGVIQLKPQNAAATSKPSQAKATSNVEVTHARQAGAETLAGGLSGGMSDGLFESLIDQPITWDLSVRRDPFDWVKLDVVSPVVTAQAVNRQAIEAAARRDLKLQAVMFDQNPRVLMNGRLLTQGSQVAGYTIKHVEKRAVVVTQQGVDVRINL